MAEILIHEGRPVLELTFDEVWDIRNAIYWAIFKKEERAISWEAEAFEFGDEARFNNRTISRKAAAAQERKLADKYEQLKDVINEYMTLAPIDRGGVSHV